ncbi:MAG: hypothetical protein IJ319_00800 [Bacteroidaceae bacterium]|nr:hypothetical protein [Bacteroidaceae bacterium]
MKSILITLDISHKETIINMLEHNNCRGFSFLDQVQGRGSKSGEPHYGSHAWPSMNGAIIAVVDDNKVDKILSEIKNIDEETPQLGLRAFVWNIEKAY